MERAGVERRNRQRPKSLNSKTAHLPDDEKRVRVEGLDYQQLRIDQRNLHDCVQHDFATIQKEAQAG